ncbi:cell envelope integrity EipB family protein [Methylocystis heyeri]|uniref:DUF1849 family protein n=1 Tax=Methylocystis heyeri TaxID=391905 RepID=A0A6B8KEH4_9HYPH|nr:cell envelope integrity EipB family protein [Methylocystis heyeri]QGM45415.1 DUF1849 family protein [Methylocystis heyeri]
MAFSRYLVFSTLVLAICGGAARGEPAPPLVPHRAVYELSLLKSTGAKAPTAAHGRIAFDFGGSACEGYVQNFRQITELQPEEGTARVSDLKSATFEAGDGQTYRFRITTSSGDSAGQDLDGAAQKASSKVAIELKRPNRAKSEFGGPVLFPTEHMRNILSSARAGENLLEARVFDGSGDGSKPYDTLAVIGKPLTGPAAEKPSQIETLKSLRRWPVSISYFETGQKDQQPAYVLSFDLYENGVSRALKLDYGDFVLAGEMTELTLLPVPKCEK